jgi:hypothetical protein
MMIHESSFKDPNGSVIKLKGEVFRVIKTNYTKEYDHLMNSGLYEELVKNELITDHSEIDDAGIQKTFGEEVHRIIKPRLVTISYPGEWCFSQLKDAALCTLKIQLLALRFNMVLKDCSAYNIQFSNGKPLLIDTLSFRFYTPGEPWIAYRQFCEHFYGPLLLTAHTDARLSVLFNSFIDGMPLDLIRKLLPFRNTLSLGVFLHVVLHSRSKTKHKNTSIGKGTHSAFTIQYLTQLAENLIAHTEKVTWKQVTNWSSYYDKDVKDAYYKAKINLVSAFVRESNGKKVLDFGANDGSITRHLSAQGVDLISTDYDHASVELNYLEVKKQGIKNVLPLVIDATNPTPAYGWANTERQSFSDRLNVDAVLALALIHHLVIFYNIPFSKAAEYFVSLADTLIIEFVPKSDPMVQVLLQAKEDVYPFYTQEAFETTFSQYFILKKQTPIPESQRILYLFQKKNVVR